MKAAERGGHLVVTVVMLEAAALFLARAGSEAQRGRL